MSETLTLRLEAYDRDAKTAVHAAQSLADDRGHAEVDPLHLFYVLLERDGAIQGAITRANVDATDVLVEAELLLRKRPRANPPAHAFLSKALLDLLGRAEGEGARRGGKPIRTTELFLACVQETMGPVREVLRSTGLTAPVLRVLLESAPASSTSTAAAPAKDAPPTAATALAEYGIDLTREAAEGRLDPTVGRDAELRRVVQVLARRRENNPLLVGEPGIGKTSIVHALAQRIARGDVPALLAGKRLVAIDVGALVAGAKLRGQLEERMRAVLAAVRDASGEVILFLPDLGAFTGQAAAAGDLLAAALGRGEVRVIGVATPDQVRKFFDEHAVLSRRFVPIPIEPPTIDEAIGVLRGLCDRYEAEHGVRIADPALVAAAQFARRYVQGVQLPKSAVDLVDEAAARVRIEREGVPSELDAVERRIESMEMQARSLANDADEESAAAREKLEREAAALRPKAAELRERWKAQRELDAELRGLEADLATARAELERAIAEGRAERESELRTEALPALEKRIEAVRASLAAQGTPLVRHVVDVEDVADVVAEWTGVPVAKMMEAETAKLLRMEKMLEERVVGQEHAVVAISKAVRRGRVGLRDPKRPIGSFLFLGPTGVGKTELAKALAEFLFDDEASLTRLDMSEFMEKHMVARLLGSPPGYVDSEAGGFLTEAVRNRPYSVILFDEMEKAHPDVFNILLQVLDDGRLSDSKGRAAQFQDTVIIMTSNVGSQLVLDHEGDAASLRDKIEHELQVRFRPEFLNRIDEIVIFDPLTKDTLLGVAGIQLRGLAKLLAQRRIGLVVSEAAKHRLVELGYEPAFGARPLKRVLLKEIQDPLAEAMLAGAYAPGDTVRVDVEGERFVFAKG